MQQITDQELKNVRVQLSRLALLGGMYPIAQESPNGKYMYYTTGKHSVVIPNKSVSFELFYNNIREICEIKGVDADRYLKGYLEGFKKPTDVCREVSEAIISHESEKDVKTYKTAGDYYKNVEVLDIRTATPEQVSSVEGQMAAVRQLLLPRYLDVASKLEVSVDERSDVISLVNSDLEAIADRRSQIRLAKQDIEAHVASVQKWNENNNVKKEEIKTGLVFEVEEGEPV